MSTVPTLPSFAAGEIASAAELNAIGATASFLLAKPIARVHDITGGQSLTATKQPITWTTKDFDTDTPSMWNATLPTRLTVQTQGWWKVRYGIQLSEPASIQAINGEVWVTTGLNNPLGLGVNLGPFVASGCGTSNDQHVLCGSSGVIPAYLYPGDWVQIEAICSNNVATTTTAVTTRSLSFFTMEWVSQ